MQGLLLSLHLYNSRSIFRNKEADSRLFFSLYMTSFRKSVRILHLWIGIISGVIVFVVCITGCLYVFKNEIADLTEPWRFVPYRDMQQLHPSEVLDIAQKEIPDKKATAITYGGSEEAVVVDYFTFGAENYERISCFIDPYTGEIQKLIRKQSNDLDFFDFVIHGHRSLWMPLNIGRPIVGGGILAFVVVLISGIILWYPRRWNKTITKRSFSLKRHAGIKRQIFDLHNVCGFYAFLLLIILSVTGLIRSFDWFSESVYRLTSGGKPLQEYILPLSDTLLIRSDDPLDMLYMQLKENEPNAKSFYIALPSQPSDVFRVSVVHEKNSYYRTDNLFYDRYTLRPLQGQGPYAGKYKERNNADKLRRMNLDIHTGQVGGLPGKILAFTASLIGASLPVTGFLIWRKRKKRSRN